MHKMTVCLRNERGKILGIQEGVKTLAEQVGSEAKRMMEQFSRFMQEHSTNMEVLATTLSERFKEFSEGSHQTLEKYAALQPPRRPGIAPKASRAISSSVDSLMQRVDGLAKTVKERQKRLESVE